MPFGQFTLCRALCRVAHMCSRTVSDTANMSRHGSTLCSPTEAKILCRSLFRSGHMSAICARPSPKEVGVKRVETLVSTLLPRRGARHVPAVRRRRISSLNLSEKPPARKGTNMPARFRFPGLPVQKKVPPGQNVALRASYAPESRRFLKTKRKTTHFREWFSWWKLTGSNR